MIFGSRFTLSKLCRQDRAVGTWGLRANIQAKSQERAKSFGPGGMPWCDIARPADSAADLNPGRWPHVANLGVRPPPA